MSPATEPDLDRSDRPTRRHAIAYMAFMSALLAVGVDIMLPAFDEIREEFGLASGSGSVTPIITIYFIAMGSAQVIHGPLSDRVGRRPVLLLGAALYATGCVGTLVAPTIGWLLASRAVWGAGAATFAVVYGATARDLYSGDEMARVVSIVSAVFLLGPVLTPLLGEALVSNLPWRSVVVAALIINAIQIVWTLRFPETLAPDDRRPLELRPIGAAFGRVMRSRTSLGHLVAGAFLYGAFFVFLSSSQPIMDEIYGRADQFAFWFAASALPAGLGLLLSQRLVRRWSTPKVLVPTAALMLAGIVLWTLVTVAADGVPGFGVWFGLVVIINATILVQSALHIAAALEPMGDIAGVAASLVGVFGTVGGAVLSSPINQAITDTVSPMAVGYLVYSLAAVAATAWALSASATVTPDASTRVDS